MIERRAVARADPTEVGHRDMPPDLEQLAKDQHALQPATEVKAGV